MKILHVGNTANDGYNNVRFLRKFGVNANLIIPKNELKTVFARPEWECNEDSHWVRIYDPLFSRFMLPQFMLYIKKFVIKNNIDIIQTYSTFGLFKLSINSPFVITCVGEIILYDRIWYPFFIKALKKSEKVLLTNINMPAVVKNLSINNWEYLPFVIDVDRYKPMKSSLKLHDGYDYVFFSSSRQTWNIKGNDKMIKAFSEFLKEYSGKLFLTSWGEDLNKSKELVSKLNIKKNVEFLNVMPKTDLIQYINACDVFLDQFVLNAYGTATPEAMSCSKPVITGINEDWALECYPEIPPVCNAYNEKEITDQMIINMDKKIRDKIGRKSREWILKHHSPSVVCDKLIGVYRELLGNK